MPLLALCPYIGTTTSNLFHTLQNPAYITFNQANTFAMASLYQQTIPVSIKYLRNLSGLLNQAVKFADGKGMKHEEMLSFRLIEDMLPV